MTKLQQITNKLDQLQQPYQVLSQTTLIIDPQSSPMYETIPFTKDVWLRDQPYTYLDVNYPYNQDWFNEFLEMSIEDIHKIAAIIM